MYVDVDDDDGKNNPCNHWYKQIVTGNIRKSQQVTFMFDKTE